MIHSLITFLLILLVTTASNAQIRIPSEPNYISKKHSILESAPMPKDSVELDSFIIQTMLSYHMVGHAGWVIKDGEIVWHKNHGYANIENDQLVSDSTLFLLGSISKTFVATAIMQLWEDGAFNLEDNINQYLPQGFEIRNPNYPDDPITFSHLLTHSSSLCDNWTLMDAQVSQGDFPITLDSLIYNYFSPDGIFYSPSRNFYNTRPGEKTTYCNMGFALLGYLVEQMVDMSFDQYCTTNIFEPLEMNNTAWFLGQLDTSNVAVPYQWQYNSFVPFGHTGMSYYPAGQLRTSALQLANFLITYMNHGTYKEFILLNNSTIESMLQRLILDDDYNIWLGLCFFEDQYAGELLWGHAGHWYGAATAMFYDPDQNYGFISLSNTGLHDISYDGQTLIAHELAKFAKFFGETNIENEIPALPISYSLSQNHPNPFNPTTKITFTLPKPEHTALTVYNTLGQKVATLLDSRMNAGSHDVQFDASDLPSGIYFYRIQIGAAPGRKGEFSQVRKMVLLR